MIQNKKINNIKIKKEYILRMSELISEILQEKNLNKEISIGGWVENKRESGDNLFFVSLRDGSCDNIQCVFNIHKFQEQEQFNNYRKSLCRSASAIITGKLINSIASGQKYELEVYQCEVLCGCEEDYPLIKGKLTLDYIRNYPQYRSRTKTLTNIYTIRNNLQLYTHLFFNENGFKHIATPLITSNDCEGAGETFNISNELESSNGEKRPFFGKNAHLTVSGQLHVEPFAHSFKRVYTFGPTFRAENSNTSRHLAEFWMIEPEISFINFNELMDNMEHYLKYVSLNVINNCYDIMKFFDKNQQNGIIEDCKKIYSTMFNRVSYTECINYINDKINDKTIKVDTKSTENKINVNGRLVLKKRPVFGDDLGSEIEKFLVKELGNNMPMFVTHFPRKLKSFYMRTDRNNPDLVEATDLLVPNVGELMGGSMREENYDRLKEVMNEKGVPEEGLEWYINLRKNGSVPHGGYGVGFERLVCYLTGTKNIRDVIFYPRAPGMCYA